MARLCALCAKRPALFRYRGVIKADADHDICQQCFRSISESNRQKEIAMDAPEIQHNFGVPVTTEPQSLKEMFKLHQELEARVFKLENQKPVDAPKAAPAVVAPKLS